MSCINFKVYKRKIYVWLQTTNGLVFQHATYAYPTCKAARIEMKRRNPTSEYVAGFAK